MHRNHGLATKEMVNQLDICYYILQLWRINAGHAIPKELIRAVVIKNEEIAGRLKEHAARLSVPTTRGRLAIFIPREVLNAAESQGKDAGEILRTLKAKEPHAA